MPKEHREYATWNGERFINWAGKIGEHTQAVVRLFLARNQIEQQGYKSCMALLKLSESHSALKLEHACQKALSFTGHPSLKSIKVILNSGKDNLSNTNMPEVSISRFTRGQEYYRRKEED